MCSCVVWLCVVCDMLCDGVWFVVVVCVFWGLRVSCVSVWFACDLMCGVELLVLLCVCFVCLVFV